MRLANLDELRWKSVFLLIMFCMISCNKTCSQSIAKNKISSNLELLKSVKRYCEAEFRMNISKSFYTDYSNSEKPNYYLFVSQKDTLASVFKKQTFRSFGQDFGKANTEKKVYDEKGYSTHLYETFGTAYTRLSKQLLQYSQESISFIAFHEATHQHIRGNKKYIPYVIQEAVCDLIGNYGTLAFFEDNNKLKTRSAKKQIRHIEDIALEINKIIHAVQHEEIIDYSFLNKKLRMLKRNKHKFKIDRYDYEINNAYLLRNRNYTLYYFKLKKLLMLMNNIEKFLEFICGLPTEESDGLIIIDTKINSLKSQSRKN